MSNITIPPAALEAGKLVLLRGIYGDDQMPCAELASAAFLAMIEAWPEMKTETTFWSNADGAGCGRNVLSLPLPSQEDGDELA